MKPFSISDGAKALVGSYLPSELLKGTLGTLRYEERLGLLRLWGSEGIPFAFRDSPLLWEAIRQWLGLRLSISPKLVTLIGSARLGYSLAPAPQFGRLLSSESDLDLSIVSESVFDSLTRDFGHWKADIADGLVSPRTPKEEKLWPAILGELPNCISRGFIDPYKIPAFTRYTLTQRLLQTQWLLGKKISITPDAPVFSHVSIRVYRDWRAFLNQMLFNLHLTISSLGPPSPAN